MKWYVSRGTIGGQTSKLVEDSSITMVTPFVFYAMKAFSQ